ncbi:hypothetical protein Fcan01_17851 [Folsomia candida]|uniref:Uncharacterized protein n=1 Tax=Folsomia candida TaxID=158441 RepID=A0A226DPR0_FOLCA|nr:hypothetical protein Fcan01_17851 [Folsomia candida]
MGVEFFSGTRPHVFPLETQVIIPYSNYTWIIVGFIPQTKSFIGYSPLYIVKLGIPNFEKIISVVRERRYITPLGEYIYYDQITVRLNQIRKDLSESGEEINYFNVGENEFEDISEYSSAESDIEPEERYSDDTGYDSLSDLVTESDDEYVDFGIDVNDSENVAQPTTTASPTFPTTTTGPPAKTTEATTTNTTPRHHTNFVYYPTTAAPTVPTVQEKLPPTGLPPPDYHHHQHSSTEVVRGGATNVPPTLPFEHGMERPSPATAPPSLPSEAPAPYNQKAVVHEKVKEASPDKTTTKNSANHDNDLVQKYDQHYGYKAATL